MVEVTITFICRVGREGGRVHPRPREVALGCRFLVIGTPEVDVLRRSGAKPQSQLQRVRALEHQPLDSDAASLALLE
jgi:hypothetical protein